MSETPEKSPLPCPTGQTPAPAAADPAAPQGENPMIRKRWFGRGIYGSKDVPIRILDGIIEMIYALDKIAPGTANDDTLLYGVEVKFYNMEVEIDNDLQTCHEGLYVIGDCSGVTHSLSHASASGVYVARKLLEKF